MQIQLKQEELEVAVRNYVELMGISRAVGDITFTTTRSPTSVLTEIEVHPVGYESTIGQMTQKAAAVVTEAVDERVTKPTSKLAELKTPKVDEPESSAFDDIPVGNKSLFAGK